ncbi:MAG TPA: hypothetical protein VF618_16000 [Thermoanaerobaculia bacterium]
MTDEENGTQPPPPAEDTPSHPSIRPIIPVGPAGLTAPLDPADPGHPSSDVPVTPEEPTRSVTRRILRTSLAAYGVFAVFAVISGGFRGFLGLTCSAAVTMISFLWLEEIVETVLQPSAHLHARRLTLRTLARFLLLGVALTVTIFVARFNALSVLLGFSVVVVGIMGEAVYSFWRR